MTAIDLIMELSKMPPDMEVIYQLSEDKDRFTMIVVAEIDEIITDNDEHYIMLNPSYNEEKLDENEED
jgi:hypothetical protein